MILTSVPPLAAVEPSVALPYEVVTRLAVLDSTYPGWRIIYLSTQDQWYAGRLPAITPAQAAAGVLATFFGDSYEEFGALLAEQSGLVDQVGGFNS